MPLQKKETHLLVGGFKCFLFSPLFGEDSQFDQYFSKGLKPPTSLQTVNFGVPAVDFRSFFVLSGSFAPIFRFADRVLVTFLYFF